MLRSPLSKAPQERIVDFLRGEPFQLFFTPDEIAAELTAFRTIEDLGAVEINPRYFPDRTDNLKILGTAGRFLSAQL